MSTFHEVTPDRADEWESLGHRRRHFFAHRVGRLPKCGPDGYKLAEWMLGPGHPASSMREVVLYGHPSVLEEFPPEVFFDDDVVWHQQQFGLPGQVATANLVLDGDVVWSAVHLSDLVQRISRRRELKTRVEKVFDGWVHMLLNAVLAYAIDEGAREVRLASCALALRHTDPERSPQPELYDRIYDRTPADLYRPAPAGEWWSVDVAAARPRVLRPERRADDRPRPGRVVCLCHDSERGLGHAAVDPEFAREAQARAPGDLQRMLEVEERAGVRTTYSVVGSLLGEV